MNVKKILSIVAALFLTIVSYGQNDFEGKVSFDKVVHDFGDLMVTDPPQKTIFVMKNIGSSPVAINNVMSSCGCTEPSWSKAPVRPGETAQIEVTFLNDQGAYPFSKTLTVYVSGLSKPVLLKIKGDVHAKKMPLSELFPHHCAGIGFKDEKIDIGQLEQGTSRRCELQCANISKRKVTMEILSSDQGLVVISAPSSLSPGEKGTFVFEVNTALLERPLWGRNNFGVKLSIDGKIYENPIRVTTVIKENFTGLSEDERRSAALPTFSVSSGEYFSVKDGDILEKEFSFKNIGKGRLSFYKADCSEPERVKVDYPSSVEAGNGGKVKVTLDTKNSPKGENIVVITLITNAPSRPLVNLFMVYTID